MKRPLQSYSSAKSLKKSQSKTSLKRQASSPYLQIIDASHSKASRSKSPKRKNKSVEAIKLKSGNVGQVGVRSKFGASFESIKKASGDFFGHGAKYTAKKDK